MFENSADSKMQLVGVGDLRPPGSCVVCGSGTRQEGYIDLGVSFDWEGNLYLCWNCTVEAAEILGCMIPAEVKHLKESYEELAQVKVTLQEELDSANERLAAYDVIARGIMPDASRHGGLLSDEVGPPGYNSDEVSGSGESQADGAQSVTSEPTEGGRSSNTSEPELTDTTGSGKSSIRLL